MSLLALLLTGPQLLAQAPSIEGPKPADTLLVKVVHVKDTLFVYQHIRLGEPGVECIDKDNCPQSQYDGILRLREVYVARQDSIKLVDVQKAIYQNIDGQSGWIYSKTQVYQ